MPITGRQTIEVRICTCPYRDLQQEEEKAIQAQIKVASINTNINIKRAPPLVVANKTRSKYHENDDVYFVPVRGLANFQQVNKYAEFLGNTTLYPTQLY